MRWAIREYLTADGSSPFRFWLKGLPVPIQARVQARIARFAAGNLGDVKSVGSGVSEARLQFGPGYRVYFAKHQGSVVLLLCGGDKGSQRKDIKRAQQFWDEYRRSEK